MAQRFNNGREKKIHLWQELASVMQSLGYPVTGSQLDWKWKSLRSRFRKARDGRTPAEGFVYYEAMKELFALEEMANALPPVLQQSLMNVDGTGGECAQSFITVVLDTKYEIFNIHYLYKSV